MKQPSAGMPHDVAVTDVIVVGLGADGSAAAAHLAARGEAVLGIEAFSRGHTLGSSGGLTRVIRLAYYEHPAYVPLLRRAWVLWRELEKSVGEELLRQVGGVCIGPQGGRLVSGSRRSAMDHGLEYELLDPAALRDRLPLFRLDTGWWGVAEPNAGFLFPERCIAAHLTLAERHGADLRFDQPVRRIARDGSGVIVETEGEKIRADRVVVTAGAWNSRLLPQLSALLHVDRVPLFWFEPVADRDDLARLPVYIVDGEKTRGCYGFPYLPGQGLKVATLGTGVACDPDTVDRATSAEDEVPVREFLADHLPSRNGALRASKVCMYTVSPDEHFVIGVDGPIVYASACSGHGFKFSTVVGEILADLSTTGRTAHDIGFISRDRFG
jgi:sarcosine oxidase